MYKFSEILPCLTILFSFIAIVTSITLTDEPTFELYMHDILGGGSPTARPITGLLGNIYNSQVPFAKPIGFRAPTVNGNNGIPLGTGLTFVGGSNHQQQLGADGLGLGFGTITVIDDVLTLSPELGSQNVGKAQGIYVASSADGRTQMMTFTAMFEGGEYGDSLNFYGLYKNDSTMSRLSVTGGTGKFKHVKGFAEVRSLIPPGRSINDGGETLLRISVYLNL
ncbi:hypothetical protein ACFE04_008831 [Oxalis oulophora]